MKSPIVWNWLTAPPRGFPKSNSSGSPNSWDAPIVETTIVNKIVGRRPGSVMWMNCFHRFAPSMAADS